MLAAIVLWWILIFLNKMARKRWRESMRNFDIGLPNLKVMYRDITNGTPFLMVKWRRRQTKRNTKRLLIQPVMMGSMTLGNSGTIQGRIKALSRPFFIGPNVFLRSRPTIFITLGFPKRTKNEFCSLQKIIADKSIAQLNPIIELFFWIKLCTWIYDDILFAINNHVFLKVKKYSFKK